MSKKKTRKAYEEYLNLFVPEYESDAWIIGGKNRNRMYPKYGSALRKHDPIAFNVGYGEWARE